MTDQLRYIEEERKRYTALLAAFNRYAKEARALKLHALTPGEINARFDELRRMEADARETQTPTISDAPASFTYGRWRHGGWYVDQVRYPSGACGCVSNNYADRKWRITCDPRPFDQQPTFKSRDAAARAEWVLANSDNWATGN